MTATLDGTFYLAFSKRKAYSRKGDLAARLTNTTPALDPNEICVRLDVKLPRALFERPTITLSLNVPGDKLASVYMDTELSDNIAQVLKDQLGIRVEVTATPPADSVQNAPAATPRE